MADRDGTTRTLLAPAPGELLHVDLLRFVASAGIVMAHSLEFLVPPPLRPWWRTRLDGLPLFVDTFFVVSGFIIARLYAGRIATWRDHAAFLQRRVARLVPLHLATVLAWLALDAALQVARVPQHHAVALTPACIATSTLLLTSMVDCGGLPVAQANWSIGAEMAMYVLFPALLWVTARRAPPAALLAAALFALVLAADRGDLAHWQAHLGIGRALPAFTFGIALAGGTCFVARVPWPRVGFAVAAALLFASIGVTLPNALLVATAYALPAFAIAADLGATGPLVRRVAPLGQLTYSVYLLHGLVVAVLLNAVAERLLQLHGLAMGGAIVASWGVVLLLARWSFVHGETPARAAVNAWRCGRGGQRPPTPLGAHG